MAANYSFNVDSPFLQSTLPKPGDRTSSNPYGLSFGGGYSDAYTKMKDRFNLQVTADLKSKHSFLNDKSINKLNPQIQGKPITKPPAGIVVEEKEKLTPLKLVKKGAEVFGKTMTIAEPFLHKDEIPENKNALLSNSIGNSIANYATTLGPWGWGYKGLHALALSTGGMLNGSNTENKVTDGLNTLLGAVPGLGWFVSKSPAAYRNAMVESSAMYGNTNLFAQEHGGGKYAIDRAGINSRIKLDNINTAVVAKHILEPAKRDFSADIAMVALGINTALTGDVDRVTNFGPVAAKQGTVLQFTKRTLSKHKIKKLQSNKSKEVIIQEPINELVDSFKEGGKVNVIPDGALHKNKHHLEEVDEKFEDVTTKGIPVIVESEDGEVIQLAEVEREEIIFRLEVTKKLEELSKKHTDEAAIEAGKLLVKEILYNTEDNTGKMI